MSESTTPAMQLNKCAICGKDLDKYGNGTEGGFILDRTTDRFISVCKSCFNKRRGKAIKTGNKKKEARSPKKPVVVIENHKGEGYPYE